jgi:hypothetical protein
MRMPLALSLYAKPLIIMEKTVPLTVCASLRRLAIGITRSGSWVAQEAALQENAPSITKLFMAQEKPATKMTLTFLVITLVV